MIRRAHMAINKLKRAIASLSIPHRVKQNFATNSPRMATCDGGVVSPIPAASTRRQPSLASNQKN